MLLVIMKLKKKKDNPIVIYQDVFGPDYYSFNYLGNHFIILNSHNVVNGSLQYEIDSTQLDWLKQDIENISQEVPITFFSLMNLSFLFPELITPNNLFKFFQILF